MRHFRTPFSLFACLAILSSAAWGENALFVKAQGAVHYRLPQSQEWAAAVKGAEIPSGASVRTGEDGRALLRFSNKSTIWMKPGTSLEIEERQSLSTRLKLVLGAIKVRVPHLKRKEKFSVRGPAAVASVRGTEFTMNAGGDGKTGLQVLFGEVRVEGAGESGEPLPRSQFTVTQGQGYGDGRVALLSKSDQQEALGEWGGRDAGDSSGGERGASRENRKEEMAASLQAIEMQESGIGDLIESGKKEDFAAGRTLLDVHGNMVRVEQRLDRPDGKTVQLVNVVKRSEYKSGGFKKYQYNGGGSARLDVLRAKVEFNMALPQNLNDMPGFFAAQGESVKVDRSELVMGRVDAGQAFTIGFFGARNPSQGTDEITPDLYVGTLSASSTESAAKKWSQLKLQADGSVAGLTRFVEDPAVGGVFNEGPDGALYGDGAERWQEFGNTGNKLWLASESFVINNAGNIRNVSDFTKDLQNVQGLLRDTAGEVALFLKKDGSDVSGGVANTPHFAEDAVAFAGGNARGDNIDLVFIPDIGLAVVQSLSSSLDSINSTR